MPNKIIGLFVLLLGGFSQFGVNLSPVVAQGETSLPSDASAACETNWQGEIDAIIQRPEFARAQWGILVRSLDAEESIYALNEQQYFLGASTVKLLTTAAALERLGTDYRIRTPFYALGQPPILETLLVAGRGDPSLKAENLSAIARQLYRQGVRQVEQLIADDRYFPEPHRSLTWELGDLFFYYAPAVNSLILNQNRFSLMFSPQQIGAPLHLSWQDEIAAAQWPLENSTVTSPAGTNNRLEIHESFGQTFLEIHGTLAVDTSPLSWDLAILNPRQYFLESLQASLENEGIQVRQARSIVPEDRTNDFVELAAIASPPLANLLQEINRASNNLYAEALLRTLGAVVGDRGSPTAGLDVVRDTLTQLGVDPDSYLLADGSGLSRHNLVSPEALVQTLIEMAQSPHFPTYRHSLAVAGVSGTLEKRFQNTFVQENLRAKTGTMRNVSALSGYLEVTTARPWVFSIILNRTTVPAIVQRQAIDDIVLILAQQKICHESFESSLSKRKKLTLSKQIRKDDSST